MGCWSCLPCTLFVCLTGHTMAVGLATVTPVRSGTRATHAAMVDTPEDWLIETNNARSGELAAVARKFSPAKESEHEKVHRVQALSANERGMEIEEVLCSTIDNSCIAITVPVAWPSERAAATASEMAEAFAALARSAKPRSATDAYDNAPRRSVFEAQGVRLSGLRNMLNARFEPHLRMLVLTHARDVISPNDELEQALMTQMCYEGFTVQLVAIDLWSHDTHGRGHDAEVGLRKTYEVSLLFYPPCRCESEVEDRIIELTMATAG